MKRRRYLGALETLALVVVDLAATALAYVIAYHLRFETDIIPFLHLPSISVQYGTIGVVDVCFVVAFAMNRLYSHRRSLSPSDEFFRVVAGVSVGTLFAMATISFVLRGIFEFSRLMVAYAWFLSIILVSVGRAVVTLTQASLRKRGVGVRRLLIVGSGSPAHIVLDKIHRSPQLGYEVVGCMDDGSARGMGSDVPLLGELEDLPLVVERFHVEEVIVALSNPRPDTILDVADSLADLDVSIKVFPDVIQMITEDAGVDDLDGLPLVAVRQVALRGKNIVIKRATDVLVSLVVLVFGSPILLLIALLVKIDSRGHVFYVQERVGKDGKPFPCIKFRSMVEDAEGETGPVWARREDARRTRIGTLLRQLSLDEFPQFVNVLLGQMSVVGPRPERPVFVQQFSNHIPRYMERHAEKAGITGWAQVNGLRGNTSVEERTKYDLYYVENWSLLLDFKIMLKTIAIMFTDKQAY
ncbi:MAG TPA: undecaprenyl-phosphate glucose phosphotransferase [Chloroflexota bacterium]|nr:undecaprenyl-phosphate glucose phosphotransferase [Chloroflexota bacterium]